MDVQQYLQIVHTSDVPSLKCPLMLAGHASGWRTVTGSKCVLWLDYKLLNCNLNSVWIVYFGSNLDLKGGQSTMIQFKSTKTKAFLNTKAEIFSILKRAYNVTKFLFSTYYMFKFPQNQILTRRACASVQSRYLRK